MEFPKNLENSFLCGSCFELLESVPDESIDLVLTDPPYGIDYQSNRRVSREKLPKFANDSDLSWVEGWVDQINRVLKNDRHFYCFTRFDTYPIFYSAISRHFKVKNCLIWIKNNHGSGDLNGSYAPQSEMIIFAAKGKRHLNGPRDSDVISCDNVPSAHRAHATQKPVELLRQLIEKSSDPDEIVLDPFAGTGSTGFACLDTHRQNGDRHVRKYLLMEINPDYRDYAMRAGLGKQEILLETKRQPIAVAPKERTTVRTRRWSAKRDQSLWLDLG
jgi:site-specific DNA-methyltransferase (adenine-specific)